MLAADLIKLSRLDCRVLIVDIVKLNLDYLDLGIFRQDFLQNICRIVERYSDMLYLALLFELKSRFIGMALFIFCRLSGSPNL